MNTLFLEDAYILFTYKYVLMIFLWFIGVWIGFALHRVWLMVRELPVKRSAPVHSVETAWGGVSGLNVLTSVGTRLEVGFSIQGRTSEKRCWNVARVQGERR